MSTFTFAKPAKVHALKTLVIFRSITRKRVIIVIQAVLTVTFITKKSHCRPQSYVALFETTSGDLTADRTVRRLWVQERRIPILVPRVFVPFDQRSSLQACAVGTKTRGTRMKNSKFALSTR